MGRQRNISSEQILYVLMDMRKNEANNNSIRIIKVNEELCRNLGFFKYKIEGKEEQSTGRLFLIHEEHDGKPFEIIYDENGKVIASRDNANLMIARDVILNERTLKKQIDMSNEFAEENNGSTSSEDTAKAGEGRDLASKEHEEDTKEENQNSEAKNNSDIQENNKDKKRLGNLKEQGVFVDESNRPLIRLNTIINGYYLWEILGIEQKLQGRLPNGVTEGSFRDGYLTIINKEEQQSKDGKEPVDKLAICTQDKNYIIELDEDIVKPMDLGSQSEQKLAQQSRTKFDDGEQDKDSLQSERNLLNDDLTRIARYEIPDTAKRFGVSENWSLAIDYDRGYIEHGQKDPSQYPKEITFVQQSLSESIRNREIGRNTLEYKLETTREDFHETESEKKIKKQLKNKATNEAELIREEDVERIVEKCTKIDGWDNIYNRKDLKDKVKKLRDQGCSEDQIIDDVKEEINEPPYMRAIYDISKRPH